MTHSENEKDLTPSANSVEFVTIWIGDQLFGLPINEVEDVFMPERITKVPLSPLEVAGVLNLRGRIVTAIDMRVRLGLPPLDDSSSRMAVGIEYKEESYGLLIDKVGEVMLLQENTKEKNPSNLDPAWREVSGGVFQLDGSLLVVLDIVRLLNFEKQLDSTAA